MDMVGEAIKRRGFVWYLLLWRTAYNDTKQEKLIYIYLTFFVHMI